MNKKVLTTAQVRAMFKNYTMSLAVAGSVLTSASCEKGDGKKDGKSGETPSAEDAKKFVTKDDLTSATKGILKADSFEKALSTDSKLKIAGHEVDFSSLKGGNVTADSLKDLLNAKGWTKDANNEVKFTADANGKTFAEVMGGSVSGSGLSEANLLAMFTSEAKDWEYVPATTTPAAKAAELKLHATKGSGETFAEALKKALKISNENAVDKNDAKIVVKGTEVGTTKKYTHEATFLKPEVTGIGNDDATREVELGKEIVEGAKKVKALDDVVSALPTIVTDASGKKHQIRTITTTFVDPAAVLAYFKALQVQGELKLGYVHKALGIIFRTKKDVATINNPSSFLSNGGKLGSARSDFEYLHRGEWISFDLKPADKSQAGDNQADGQFNAADYAGIEPIVGGAKFSLNALNVA